MNAICFVQGLQSERQIEKIKDPTSINGLDKSDSVINYKQHGFCSNTKQFYFGEQVMWKWFPPVIWKISVAFLDNVFSGIHLSDKEYSWIFIFFFF